MIYLELFLAFLEVGFFSFGGGYASIPLIRDVVMSYGWMSDAELTNIIAVSESTPGPIMVNLATYVGSNEAGLLGAIIATTTVVIPSFAITIIVMVILKNIMNNKYVSAVIQGLKPSIVGIILATGALMIIEKIIDFDMARTIQMQSIIVMAFLSLTMFVYKLVRKKSMSPFVLILIAAVCGIVIY